MSVFSYQWKDVLKRSKQSSAFGILLLCIFYLIGILGIAVFQFKDFILLTPFNLLVSLAIILYYHPTWNRHIVASLLLSFSFGFFIEAVGVNTGLIFGEYRYGQVLGWKIWDTPLMIGINWAMLIYSVGVTINRISRSEKWWLKAALGASMMLLLDILIEPVAIHYEFWTWEAVNVPLQNYISWWLISYGLLAFFHFSDQKPTNKVATGLLVLQFVFFAILLLSRG
ncbi:MAG: carotenoid biosynthesis protein [Bacteroidota bacterium]